MATEIPGLVVVDLVGVVVFGLSGALLAVRRHLDLFGVIALAVVTGTGGGMMRDVLAGLAPPAALRDWRYLAAGLAAGVLGALLSRLLTRFEGTITVLDAVGLGVFAYTGTTVAVGAGLGILPAVFLGVITGVGGGMVRDLLAGQVPLVLQREVYATAALLGALVTYAGATLGVGPLAVVIAATVLTAGTRLVAIRLDWHLPAPAGPQGR